MLKKGREASKGIDAKKTKRTRPRPRGGAGYARDGRGRGCQPSVSEGGSDRRLTRRQPIKKPARAKRAQPLCPRGTGQTRPEGGGNPSPESAQRARGGEQTERRRSEAEPSTGCGMEQGNRPRDNPRRGHQTREAGKKPRTADSPHAHEPRAGARGKP